MYKTVKDCNGPTAVPLMFENVPILSAPIVFRPMFDENINYARVINLTC